MPLRIWRGSMNSLFKSSAPGASPGASATTPAICPSAPVATHTSPAAMSSPATPLMHPAFYIRPARVEEAAALSDLCFRSKAVWGYDPEFMALMLAALGVAGEDIAAGDVWVATGADRQIAGVVALAPGDAPGALDLNKLFIEPRHIRSGVGRALLAHAIAEARRHGAGRLTILADPNAAAFYERAGAVRIGEAPSDAVRPLAAALRGQARFRG